MFELKAFFFSFVRKFDNMASPPKPSRRAFGLYSPFRQRACHKQTEDSFTIIAPPRSLSPYLNNEDERSLHGPSRRKPSTFVDACTWTSVDDQFLSTPKKTLLSSNPNEVHCVPRSQNPRCLSDSGSKVRQSPYEMQSECTTYHAPNCHSRHVKTIPARLPTEYGGNSSLFLVESDDEHEPDVELGKHTVSREEISIEKPQRRKAHKKSKSILNESPQTMRTADHSSDSSRGVPDLSSSRMTQLENIVYLLSRQLADERRKRIRANRNPPTLPTGTVKEGGQLTDSPAAHLHSAGEVLSGPRPRAHQSVKYESMELREVSRPSPITKATDMLGAAQQRVRSSSPTRIPQHSAFHLSYNGSIQWSLGRQAAFSHHRSLNKGFADLSLQKEDCLPPSDDPNQ